MSHVHMYATGGRWPSGREDRAGSLQNGTRPSGGWVESVVFSTIEDNHADKHAGILGPGYLDIQQISCSAQTGAAFALAGLMLSCLGTATCVCCRCVNVHFLCNVMVLYRHVTGIVSRYKR